MKSLSLSMRAAMAKTYFLPCPVLIAPLLQRESILLVYNLTLLKITLLWNKNSHNKLLYLMKRIEEKRSFK